MPRDNRPGRIRHPAPYRPLRTGTTAPEPTAARPRPASRTRKGLILDLFAGPGGWSEGLRPLGLADLGLEWDEAACATRQAAGHATIRCDVAIHPTRPPRGRRVAGLIASPPCQAWSRAGRRLGLLDQPLVHQAVTDLAEGRDTRAQLLTACRDNRSLLAAEPMRYLHDLRPAWVALEEVPPVMPLWQQYAAILTSWGYSAWTGTLNAADYGVPQTRRRAILIASRERDVAAPPPTHIDPRKHTPDCVRQPWMSMAQALGWGATERTSPTICAGGGRTGGPEPYASGSRRALERARCEGAWALRQGERARATRRCQHEPAPTLLARHDTSWEPGTEARGAACCDPSEWILRHNTSAHACRRRGNQPAGTLHFGHRLNTVTWERRTHRQEHHESADPPSTPAPTSAITTGAQPEVRKPEESVRISAEEAAILQSFPADYPFVGTKTRRFEQIGNAVPPLMATHIIAAATGLPLPESLRPSRPEPTTGAGCPGRRITSRSSSRRPHREPPGD